MRSSGFRERRFVARFRIVLRGKVLLKERRHVLRGSLVVAEVQPQAAQLPAFAVDRSQEERVRRRERPFMAGQVPPPLRQFSGFRPVDDSWEIGIDVGSLFVGLFAFGVQYTSL